VGAPPVRLDYQGEALYVTDGAGVRWRVHDVAFGPPDAAPGRRRRVPLGSVRATYRWFVNAEGVERCYRFELGTTIVSFSRAKTGRLNTVSKPKTGGGRETGDARDSLSKRPGAASTAKRCGTAAA
jgi:hypothetical protein